MSPRSGSAPTRLDALADDADVVKRTVMRLSVTGRLVETKHKYSLAPLPESDQG